MHGLAIELDGHTSSNSAFGSSAWATAAMLGHHHPSIISQHDPYHHHHHHHHHHPSSSSLPMDLHVPQPAFPYYRYREDLCWPDRKSSISIQQVSNHNNHTTSVNTR